MFSHVMTGSNDIERSKAFYDAFATMSGKPGKVDAHGRLVYTNRGGRLMLSKPIDGEPACCANGGTVGFTSESLEVVEAWHAAAIQNGGESVEDPPGVRKAASGKLYLAYIRDPDGNKLCALHRMAG